jgi:hypothetical protein
LSVAASGALGAQSLTNSTASLLQSQAAAVAQQQQQQQQAVALQQAMQQSPAAAAAAALYLQQLQQAATSPMSAAGMYSKLGPGTGKGEGHMCVVRGEKCWGGGV